MIKVQTSVTCLTSPTRFTHATAITWVTLSIIFTHAAHHTLRAKSVLGASWEDIKSKIRYLKRKICKKDAQNIK